MEEIKQAKLKDAERIQELIDQEDKVGYTLNFIEDLIRTDAPLSLELVVDDKIIGGLGARVEGENSAYLYYIVVDKSYRKNGYARKLMKEFFNEAKNNGIKRIALDTPYPEFFGKFGFKEVGKLPDWDTKDQFIMLKELDEI